MEFRIADTFVDSLAKLSNPDQKAVKTTVFDLQVKPASPGMSFHKLDHAQDPNFASVRVSSAEPLLRAKHGGVHFCQPPSRRRQVSRRLDEIGHRRLACGSERDGATLPVSYANTFDEPVGGLMNVLLTEDGQHYQHTDTKETPALPLERVRRAIATGVFDGAGRRYSCEKEVKESTNRLLNRIAETSQRIAGGGLSWDAIILTGGGSGLLYKRLQPILN